MLWASDSRQHCVTRSQVSFYCIFMYFLFIPVVLQGENRSSNWWIFLHWWLMVINYNRNISVRGVVIFDTVRVHIRSNLTLVHLPLNLPVLYFQSRRLPDPCQHLNSVPLNAVAVEVSPWSLAGQHFLQKDWNWSSRVAWAQMTQMDISSHLKSWRPLAIEPQRWKSHRNWFGIEGLKHWTNMVWHMGFSE